MVNVKIQPFQGSRPQRKLRPSVLEEKEYRFFLVISLDKMPPDLSGSCLLGMHLAHVYTETCRAIMCVHVLRILNG